MTTIFKKFFLVWAAIVLSVMSSGAMAVPSTYTATVNGTSYDFTYFTGSYNDNTVLLESQPWWGQSDSIVLSFVSAVGTNLGTPNVAGYGPFFVRSITGIAVDSFFVRDINGLYTPDGPYGVSGVEVQANYVVASGGIVPEMNVSLTPQVGFLLAGLFLMFGCRKENTKPMLAA